MFLSAPLSPPPYLPSIALISLSGEHIKIVTTALQHVAASSASVHSKKSSLPCCEQAANASRARHRRLKKCSTICMPLNSKGKQRVNTKNIIQQWHYCATPADVVSSALRIKICGTIAWNAPWACPWTSLKGIENKENREEILSIASPALRAIILMTRMYSKTPHSQQEQRKKQTGVLYVQETKPTRVNTFRKNKNKYKKTSKIISKNHTGFEFTRMSTKQIPNTHFLCENTCHTYMLLWESKPDQIMIKHDQPKRS